MNRKTKLLIAILKRKSSYKNYAMATLNANLPAFPGPVIRQLGFLRYIS